MEIYQGTANAIYKFNQFELDQHDISIRASERQKVLAEVTNIISKADADGFEGYNYIIQKLTELRGEK